MATLIDINHEEGTLSGWDSTVVTGYGIPCRLGGAARAGHSERLI